MQLLLEEFGKYAAGRQAYFTNIYNQVSVHWQSTQPKTGAMRSMYLQHELHT